MESDNILRTLLRVVRGISDAYDDITDGSSEVTVLLDRIKGMDLHSVIRSAEGLLPSDEADDDTLVIVPSKPYPFGAVTTDDIEDIVDRYTNAGHTPTAIGYLHGTLCEWARYDMGICLNGERITDGRHKVDVIGYTMPCTAYIWHWDKMLRCLIVDDHDTDAVSYAEKCISEKRNIL